jgi:predicted transcriptional regulator
MAQQTTKEPRPTRSFTARLATDTLDILQQLASEDDRSLAYMVQKAIDAYAEEHGTKGKRSK